MFRKHTRTYLGVSIAVLILMSAVLPTALAGSSDGQSDIYANLDPDMPEVSIERLVSVETGGDIDDGIDLLNSENKAMPGEIIFMEVEVETASGEELIDQINFELEYNGDGQIGDAKSYYYEYDIESDQDWGGERSGTYSFEFNVDNMMRFSNDEGWVSRAVVHHDDVNSVERQQTSTNFDVDSHIVVRSVDPAYAEVEVGAHLSGSDFYNSQTGGETPKVEIEANSAWRLENSPNEGWTAVSDADHIEGESDEQGYFDEHGEFTEQLSGVPISAEGDGGSFEIYYQVDIPAGQDGGRYETNVEEDHENYDLAENPTHTITNLEL